MTASSLPEMNKKLSKFIKPSIFFQCSEDSFKDALVLFKSEIRKKKNGAIYLAGFSLECYLKYCIYKDRKKVEEKEVKKLGHNLAELFARLKITKDTAQKLHIQLEDINAWFCRINEIWYNEIRYVPKEIPKRECEKFFKDVKNIRRLLWQIINI